MKKMIFSAIMMIAFSGVSMANDIEINTESIGLPCTDAYVQDMEYLQDHGLPEDQAEFFANAAWEQCMDDTYGDDWDTNSTPTNPNPKPIIKNPFSQL